MIPIYAALITVSGTLLGILIQFYLSQIDFRKNSRSRKKILTGSWIGEGQIVAYRDDKPLGYELNMELSAYRRRVKADGITKFTDRDGTVKEQSFTGSGGFMYSRFLKLDYIAKHEGAVHFGTVILELDNVDGKTLRGAQAGYGAFSKKPVHGTIEFRKVS